MQLRSRSTALLLALSLGTTLISIPALAQNTTEQPDKYQWLEDVNGDRSMAWVNAENARSAKVLQADPHFDTLAETALKVLESPTRLPSPNFRVGAVYNTWQDAQHVRGILRRTALDSYLKDSARLAHRHRLRRPRHSRTTRSGSPTASTASIPATASASSSSPPAVKTPTPSASSTYAPASSSKAASSSLTPSRTSPGSTKTPSSSPATGAPAP